MREAHWQTKLGSEPGLDAEGDEESGRDEKKEAFPAACDPLVVMLGVAGGHRRFRWRRA